MVSHTAYADLEIRILAREAQGYPVEMTLNHEQEFPRGSLDPKSLPLPWVATASAEADGERLFRWLLADVPLKIAWAEVRGQYPQRRVRLRIDARAPELHALPWELLRDPGEGMTPQHLAAAVATPFSRYLAGKWQSGSPILKRPIKVLVAIADPENLKAQNLEPIKEEEEWATLQHATIGLENIKMDPLPKPCTLAALEAKLKEGYHVLQFIGHGSYSEEDKKAVLYLADRENQVKLESDNSFAEMLARQLAATEIRRDDKLRLVFLASCRTATRSPADAFRGLAPKLVEAGVPAVVAMQDLVPVKTAQEFAGNFYRQLLHHGQVDLAANEARSSLLSAGLPGASIPVLFMRLPHGQLFAQRGQILGDRAGSFWSTLLSNIAAGKCTPILGPGVTAGLLPAHADLAQQLAAEHNYPFGDAHNLPRVAQFVGTEDNEVPRQETIRKLVAGFKRRMGFKLDPAADECGLCKTIESTNWPRCIGEELESEIHQQLADLDLPLYVTTNFDNFMVQALKAKNRPARRESVNWQEQVSQSSEAKDPHFDLKPPPSREEPVVLHLFGTDDDPISMVLTEDDHLDYLARISQDHEYLLPTSVQKALASTTLLFLGYRLEDLDLKVILRGLLPKLHLEKFRKLHVSVQIESSEVDQSKHEEVTRYFQKYFSESKIDVYWGSVQQFVTELHSRWQEYRHA